MTYSPGSPGSSGYPPGPPPGSYGAPAGPYSPTGPVADPGPSKLPQYLTIAVVVLGLAAYLASFGPVFSTPIAQVGAFTVVAYDSGTILMTLAAVLASLLAAVSLLPKINDQSTLVAILSVIGVLVVLGAIFTKDASATIGWALWLVLALTVLQAAAAIMVLLYDTEVLSPPAPKPRYDQQFGQYGQYTPYGAPGGYSGGFYGAPGQAPGQAPSPPTNPQ
uniref:DUF5336 domain-containing protein n=1 Tax=Mycolicibacterium palauense TaxID=2034511 RepID=UPI000BFEB59B